MPRSCRVGGTPCLPVPVSMGSAPPPDGVSAFSAMRILHTELGAGGTCLGAWGMSRAVHIACCFSMSNECLGKRGSTEQYGCPYSLSSYPLTKGQRGEAPLASGFSKCRQCLCQPGDRCRLRPWSHSHR